MTIQRLQNLHVARPWPGTTPTLSELLSDNVSFRDFVKAVEISEGTKMSVEEWAAANLPPIVPAEDLHQLKEMLHG